MLPLGTHEIDTDKYLERWVTFSRHSRARYRRRLVPIVVSSPLLTPTTKH